MNRGFTLVELLAIILILALLALVAASSVGNIVRDSKEKPIVCIELSKDYKCIIQAKAKFNGRLPKNLYSFVKKWCKTNNINYDKCYDLKYYKNEGGDLVESID